MHWLGKVSACVPDRQWEFPGCETLIAKIIFKLSTSKRCFGPNPHLICFYFLVPSLEEGKWLQTRHNLTEERGGQTTAVHALKFLSVLTEQTAAGRGGNCSGPS